MNSLLIVAIVIISILLFYFVICILLTFVINKKSMGVRSEDPDNPCYLRFEDYENELEREKYRGGYYNEAIDGYIYKEKNRNEFKGFIILIHGFGGSHIQYLVDIDYLCKEGYKVLAYDQYGVGLSEGKSMVSFSTGIYVAENVIKQVKEKNLNTDLPIILYGHSWGAYCVCGALKKNQFIKKAIIRSGFVDPIEETLYMIKQLSKPLYYIVRPLYRITYLILFSHSNMVKANKCIQKNNKTQCLIIQAKDDTMIAPNSSLANFYLKHPQKNVQVLLTEKGMHNSIITEEAQETYKQYCANYEQLKKILEPTEKKMKIDQFVLSLNRREMYPYNLEVKDKIVEFLNKD